MTRFPTTRLGRIAAAGLLVLLAVPAVRAINREPHDDRIRSDARQRLTRLVAETPVEARPVLVAGDSHAAAIALAPLCGEMPAQGGVGGVTTAAYAAAWTSLPERGRYRAIVLALGTNDQLARRHPERARSEHATRRAERALIADMARRTDTLIVLAVPPNAATRYATSQSGIRARNRWLAEVCGREGCRFLDPFASSRKPDGETMRPGYAEDGVHYNNYAPIRAEISKNICPVTQISKTQKTR